MKPSQIDRFFTRLDAHLGRVATVIVTGAGAGSIMGHIRPSMDIDFEIRLRLGNSSRVKKALIGAIEQAQAQTGIAVNYSEDISGWSMVSFLDYRRKAKPYKRFGRVTVNVMAPEHWTIGKMVRFLELDIKDMVKIIRAKRLRALPLVRLWAKAADKSKISLQLDQFRKNVILFVRAHGKKLWGRKTDTEALLESFF